MEEADGIEWINAIFNHMSCRRCIGLQFGGFEKSHAAAFRMADAFGFWSVEGEESGKGPSRKETTRHGPCWRRISKKVDPENALA
jgi:hypothetical protein